MGKFQLNKKGEDPLKIYEDVFKIANDTVETHLDKLGRMPKPISESKASEGRFSHYTDYFDQAYSDRNDENPITGYRQCDYCDSQFRNYDDKGMIDHANSRHNADLDPNTGETPNRTFPSWDLSRESKASEFNTQPPSVENGWVRTDLGDIEIFDGRVLPSYRLSDPTGDGSRDMEYVDLPEGGRVNLSVWVRESKAGEWESVESIASEDKPSWATSTTTDDNGNTAWGGRRRDLELWPTDEDEARARAKWNPDNKCGMCGTAFDSVEELKKHAYSLGPHNPSDFP
jgi:hypothetical protein